MCTVLKVLNIFLWFYIDYVSLEANYRLNHRFIRFGKSKLLSTCLYSFWSLIIFWYCSLRSHNRHKSSYMNREIFNSLSYHIFLILENSKLLRTKIQSLSTSDLVPLFFFIAPSPTKNQFGWQKSSCVHSV